MNFFLNRLDHIHISSTSFEFISADIKKDINMDGILIGPNAEYLIDGKNIMILVHASGLQNLIGANYYDALMRKPMMLFCIPTQEDEFEGTKDFLDRRYGAKGIHLNNFAQAFSIACWFIKDSCVSASHTYWINLFNGYNSQGHRDMTPSMSNSRIAETSFSDAEVQTALSFMYTVLRYLLPDESKTGRIEMTHSGGTVIWEIEKALSMEGNSFARALILLQEARRTCIASAKIDKYCALLECLYAIKKDHKNNISQITAAYIGRDEAERNNIVAYMRDAYGVRSDRSHGENLGYLKDNNPEDLNALSQIVDDYVRRVFTKVIADNSLNYDTSSEQKSRVRAYFNAIKSDVYP